MKVLDFMRAEPWPSSSSDLNPFYYVLWSILESNVMYVIPFNAMVFFYQLTFLESNVMYVIALNAMVIFTNYLPIIIGLF